MASFCISGRRFDSDALSGLGLRKLPRSRFMRCLIFFLMTVAVSLALANSVTAQAAPDATRKFAIAGDRTCPVPLPNQAPSDDGWSEAELWAWERICLGERADMSKVKSKDGDGKKCKPWEIKGEVPKHRILRPEFLHLILTRDPWRDAPLHPQVRVNCAVIERLLNLQNAEVNPELFITNSHFQAGADLLGAKFDKTLAFQSSRFDEKLDADRLSVGGSLFLRGGGSFKAVDLLGAKVVGNVEADGSSFDGKFRADSLTVGGSLFLRRGGSFQDVDLIGVRVAGSTQLFGSFVAGNFDVTGANLGAYNPALKSSCGIPICDG